LEAFKQCIDVNLVGSFLCTREAVKIFKKQSPPGGRIINNGSLSARVPRPHSHAYTSAKHAISGLSKTTALDGRPFNITCTQIDIGNAATAMVTKFQGSMLQGDGRVISEATFDVAHVADMVVHIAGLPRDVQVSEVNIMASKMPFVGRG